LIYGGPDKTVLYKLNKYLPIYNRNIELLILSHPHSDHITGLIEVLKRYKVKKVMFADVQYDSVVYTEFKKIIQKKNIEIIKLENFYDDFIEIIYFNNKKLDDANDNSIVFRLNNVNKKILFAGDISVDIEKEILNNADYNLLKADILKVAHQGSITSSSEEFVSAVDPDFAVISVGENDFGHPSLRVIKRLERAGAEILRTDLNDDVRFDLK